VTPLGLKRLKFVNKKNLTPRRITYLVQCKALLLCILLGNAPVRCILYAFHRLEIVVWNY
jgi:hypothetical protein